MTFSPLLISLPIADRPRAHAFYQAALGLEPVGEPADDGVPEPLLFALNEGTHLMLVPTGGFGWVIGDHEVAAPGTSECVIGIAATTDEEVDQIVERARRAGAVVATEPAPQPWGYATSFTDPDGHVWTVTSAPLPT
jgi:predicted lactoylglutathione lyase